MKQKLIAILGLFVVFAMVLTGCGSKTEEASSAKDSAETTEAAEVTAPYLKDLEAYKDVLETLPEDSYYAFASMSEEHDALLVTDKAFEFDGEYESAEATVYGFDKDGNVKEYGKVASSTTSMPLTEKGNYVYYGAHHSVSGATIDEAKSKLVTVTEPENTEDGAENAAYNDLFSTYMDGTIISFSKVSDGLAELAAK